MAYIPDDVLDQIRMRADIVDLIQSYVPNLKRAGAGTWKACCPFHQEKTPSFTVNEQRQSYKCFGCGAGGNAFTFIMEMEKLDFPNAAEFLARKYGVVIPEPEPWHPGAGRKKKQDAGDCNLRERLYALHELLANWYADNLAKNAVPEVCTYFATRGISPEFTRRFLIGASPDSWSAAIDLAKKKGYTEEELRLSGLVSEKENRQDHIYDRFRNRLMFPIWNEQGRVVAFSARSVEKDPQGWKYLNSPETPVFKKSRTLYALHFARTAIAEKKYAVLCEGQLDVIAVHRAGCTCAVAAQGTAFGTEHAGILKRYTGEIRLALDNDKAGRKAVFADAEILLPMGFSVKVATWQNAKDADEMLKDQGADAVRAVIEDAVDFFEFAWQDALTRFDLNSPGGKAAIAGEMLNRIALLDHAATQDAYLIWLAEKLGVTADSLRLDLQQKNDSKRRTEQIRKRRAAEQKNAKHQDTPELKKETVIPFSERSEGLHKAFRELLRILLEDEDFARRAAHDVEESMCDNTPAGIALDLIIQAALNDRWKDAPSIILMELAKTGVNTDEISGMITGQAAEIKTEEPENNPEEENGNTAAEEPAPHSEIDIDLDEIFGSDDTGDADSAERAVREKRQLIYSDCIRLLQQEQCRVRIEELMAESAALSDDDPEKLRILKQVNELSRRILTIRQR